MTAPRRRPCVRARPRPRPSSSSSSSARPLSRPPVTGSSRPPAGISAGRTGPASGEEDGPTELASPAFPRQTPGSDHLPPRPASGPSRSLLTQNPGRAGDAPGSRHPARPSTHRPRRLARPRPPACRLELGADPVPPARPSARRAPLPARPSVSSPRAVRSLSE